MFIKTLILKQFGLKYFIQIKIKISSYLITKISCYLTLNNLG